MSGSQKKVTPRQLEAIIRLLGEGLSNREIAAVLNYPTTNTVVGIIHRNKLAQYRRTAAPKHLATTRAIAKAMETKRLKVEAKIKNLSPTDKAKIMKERERKTKKTTLDRHGVSPYSGLKLMVDLRHDECRWPVEERPDIVGKHLFCSKPVKEGAFYCQHHKNRSLRLHSSE